MSVWLRIADTGTVADKGAVTDTDTDTDTGTDTDTVADTDTDADPFGLRGSATLSSLDKQHAQALLIPIASVANPKQYIERKVGPSGS